MEKNSKINKFITERLRKLTHQFKGEGIQIRYEFQELTNVHLVEVLPFDLFENNTDYVLLEAKLQDEFEETFETDEELIFISDNSLNEIKEGDGVKIENTK